MSIQYTGHCAHCGKRFDEKNPAYLGLLLHRTCYYTTTGQKDDQKPVTLTIKAP